MLTYVVCLINKDRTISIYELEYKSKWEYIKAEKNRSNAVKFWKLSGNKKGLKRKEHKEMWEMG